MAYDEQLAARVRELMAARPDVVERKMFGGVGWMVGGNMAVGVMRETELVVRIEPEETEAACREPHVHEFGRPGRKPMTGFVLVEPEGLEDDDALARWVDVGVDVFAPAEAIDAVRAALEAAGAVPVTEDAAETLRVERGRPRYGVDLICDAERTDEVKAALGVPEVGEAVAEIVRVEHGRPRFGIELDDSVIPQEAGLNERAVSFTKGCYVGQETAARLHYRGKPNRHLRGLRLSEPVATGEPLRLGEREVGRVGTSVVSPAHGPIALALVRREAAPGDTVAAGEATATVVELPF